MITMNDIAAKAGVSRSTVSLVLNERHLDLRISEGTRQRINQVAQDMGYHRNELARAVVTGNSRVIGLLTGAPEAESSGRILAGALDEAEGAGFFVKVLRLRNDNELDAATLSRCLEMRLTALLVLYLHGEGLQRLRGVLQEQHLPVAVADDVTLSQESGVHVLSDYLLGMDQAVGHLRELGHRRIALLTGMQAQELPAAERQNAFLSAMNRCNLPIPSGFVVGRGGSAAQVEAAACEILKLPRPPTAIIAGTDMTGLVIQRAARSVGLRIPDRLSVVGFGNSRLAEWADPPLTLVEQPFYQIGRVAVRHLLARLSQRETPWNDPLRIERLPTELVVRASTSPAPCPKGTNG